MKTSLFDYDLNIELIAQYPPKQRGNSKLMVLDRETKSIQHKKYSNIPDFAQKGDVIVLNHTKVIKARVFPVVKRTGRKVEVLFLNKLPSTNAKNTWYCLIGRARHVKIGDILLSGSHKLIVADREEGSPGFIVETDDANSLMKQYGHVPLPPYIKRNDEDLDKKRYNTVFAKINGAVAAPTASLNLTKEILENLQEKGVKICYVNLVVGWGTFAPVTTEDAEDFEIHSEWFEVPDDTVECVNNCEGRIWAFGTTVVRALESVAAQKHTIKKFSGETNLFIYPGHKFQIVDVLVTNFHVPKSSLIMLVCAFAGRKFILDAYKTAQACGYRFLSYGDSMLIT